jgi:PilZ domain-containing protein
MILRTSTPINKPFIGVQSVPSRRHYPRVQTPNGVWVYWNCKGREDTSRVRDLSTGGLFLETEEAADVNALIRLDFLVQDGQIRAKATVRHAKRGRGLGLKFTAMPEEDGPRLAALVTRLRSLPGSRTSSK